MEADLNTQCEELAGIQVDDDLLDVDEPFIVKSPVFEDLQQKPKDFYALCQFTVHHFQQAQIDQKQGIDPEDDGRRAMAAMESTDWYKSIVAAAVRR
jgi:hypothetical protein